MYHTSTKTLLLLLMLPMQVKPHQDAGCNLGACSLLAWHEVLGLVALRRAAGGVWRHAAGVGGRNNTLFGRAPQAASFFILSEHHIFLCKISVSSLAASACCETRSAGKQAAHLPLCASACPHVHTCSMKPICINSPHQIPRDHQMRAIHRNLPHQRLVDHQRRDLPTIVQFGQCVTFPVF